MATYNFRIRFDLSVRALLNIDGAEWLISDGVTVRSVETGKTIGESTKFVIKGVGYESREAASAAGEGWRDVMQSVFSRLGIGADFLDRGPGGMFLSTAGAALFQEEYGVERVLAEEHGVMVYEAEPPPRFISGSAHGVAAHNVDRIAKALAKAKELSPTHSATERLAFNIYSASFFQPSADARLLSLMMAVELLLEPQPRSASVRAHVQALIESTQSSDLPANEIASIVGSLRWLETESIGQSGRRLADKLGPREYMGMNPAKFFTTCYALRSALVHGHTPMPSWETVSKAAGQLQRFVGDLLSGSLLTEVPD